MPLLARVYPNGPADVNHFQAAGGMGYLIAQLLNAGLLHNDVVTVAADNDLSPYINEPQLQGGNLVWSAAPTNSLDEAVLAPVSRPFSVESGLQVLDGNLGRAVIKVSAVAPERRIVEAPAVVFNDQSELISAFDRGELEKDFVAVVRFQGPKANGMPELHKLTPVLGVLQDKGFKVALVTDGRMSGASGKVPAAIHITPESLCGGTLALVKDGDVIKLDADNGDLMLLVDEAELKQRIPLIPDLGANQFGNGRELFSIFRDNVGPVEDGANSLI